MTKIKTIIVEDDPMVMQVNCQYIEEIGGFNIVATAESGKEALNKVQEHRPQLVILDNYLPDIGGVLTLQEIRKFNVPTDVIMVTAAKDVETIQQAFRFGAVDYIVKPFKYERLKRALESYKLLQMKFNKKNVLSQEEIDNFKASQKNKDNESREALPKGLNESTLKQVLLYLIKQQTELSAEEVAEGVGLARVTVRRYLEYLEKSGKVKLEIQYGSVGRPVNRYKIS